MPRRESEQRVLFHVGVVGIILVELANVYFIMPLPGSQHIRSVEWSYRLHEARWLLRGGCAALALAGLFAAWRAPGWRRWLVPASLAAAAAVAYGVNVHMAADRIFLQPHVVAMEPVSRNQVAPDRLVVGIVIDGEARAYPLRYIGYHHQVRDTVAGREVLVSYCTVCRTGRVFYPVVNGRSETFRLVGMDRFNAMFEDRTTRSWWRQANGEAVVGDLHGTALPEVPSQQMTLRQWMALHPRTLVMQGDPAFAEEYAKDYAYERGTSRKTLTGTDTTSWGEKSWVVGVTLRGRSKAYDWNRIRQERVVHDAVGGTPIVIALGADDQSFFVFERPAASTRFTLRGDSLVSPAGAWALDGAGETGRLVPVQASQEFWHSWRSFQPETERY